MAVVLAYDLKDHKQALKEFEIYLRLAPNAPDVENIKQEMKKIKTG
jgi:regulator of sirC expression with transglutaminase-like and TPR domain